ncbi:MAG: hypothetical protein H6697_12650 [Myxococcales bacterium]|nr:hypothetical protein [Myxococcales bacterium]
MTNPRRFAVVVLMLLSQMAGGLVVICDEGVSGRVMEFLPQLCCETQVDGSPTSPIEDQGQDPCGPCYDTPLVPFVHVEDEFQSSVQFQLAFVATLEDTPLTQLFSCGATARDKTSLADISTTVRQLAGTVVLIC